MLLWFWAPCEFTGFLLFHFQNNNSDQRYIFESKNVVFSSLFVALAQKAYHVMAWRAKGRLRTSPRSAAKLIRVTNKQSWADD